MFGIPCVDAGKIDMFPTERRNMLEQSVGDLPAVLPEVGDGATEIDGVPMDNGADDQIQAGSTEGLALEGSVANLTAFVEEDGTLELVGGLALIETGRTPPTQRRAQYHSIMNKDRSIRPSPEEPWPIGWISMTRQPFVTVRP